MASDPQQWESFKAQVHLARTFNREAWESSSKLVGHAALADTLSRLMKAIEGSDQPAQIKQTLRDSLAGGSARTIQQIHAGRLKQLTGLPKSKAVRALCVLFGLADSTHAAVPRSAWSPSEIESFLRTHRNPYDLLVDIDVASLLDLGAGDLSFACELADRYVPLLQRRQRRLVLHAVDRLQPGSHLGGRLHADPAVLKKLTDASSVLHFKFWGNQDMLNLDRNKNVWPCYTMVTCHGPATPTFAYEPARISLARIKADLECTKGAFRAVRVDGEEALEVHHAGRSLLFPPWKFEVKGPLALLNVLAQRGKSCVMASVDMQVFWEILSQLFEDPRVRPPDVIYTPETLPDVFGPRYKELMNLPLGNSLVLSDLGELRSALPVSFSDSREKSRRYRFRYVELRRGALFDGIPASQTARLFNTMTEEAPPWFFVLVPEPVQPLN